MAKTQKIQLFYLTASGVFSIGRQRRLALLGRTLISPPRRRQTKFTFEGPAECFLGFVADRMRQLGNRLARLSQVQFGGLKSPPGEVSNRRHADKGCESFHECATRKRNLFCKCFRRPGCADFLMDQRQSVPDMRIFQSLKPTELLLV